MAEEKVSPSTTITPAASAPEMETPQHENGNKPADVDRREKKSESTEKGAEKTAVAEVPKTNGEAQSTSTNPTDQSTAPQPDTEDIEMKNIDEADEAVVPASISAAPPTNGTPSASKRASIAGSSKKKSAGVPEHKSKKLNKKKSKPLTNLGAKPGEYFIARMKGHPPWPSIICDEDMLPDSLLKSRPVTAQLPDGSFKKPEYADGGKRAYERTFPIMFLHTNEFAWIPNTELAPLDVESDATTNPLEKGKSKTLLAAYAKAAENHDLEHFKTMLAAHAKALEADAEEREERAAKKATKKSRKSEATVVTDDADEMDVDEEVAEKPKSKKRKKVDDSEDVDEKPAKTPRTATKLKLSTPKTPAAESSTKKKASKAKAAKVAKSVSDEEAVTPKAEEKPLTPQQAKEVKEKKVLYYRHKLQRGFLSRDTPPKEDEMKSMSDFLAELETYPDLESSIIRTTKIHKVLKAMLKLPSIPLDEQFLFKSRSVELLSKWNEILSNDAGGAANDKDGDKDDDPKPESEAVDALKTAAADLAPATNGQVKTTEEQAEKAEAGEATAPEEESPDQLENRIGTTVEGAKEAENPKESAAAAPEKTAEEKKTDGPAIESAPEQEYKPDETVEATA